MTEPKMMDHSNMMLIILLCACILTVKFNNIVILSIHSDILTSNPLVILGAVKK